MASKKRSVKNTDKKAIITFEGEESLIVPKGKGAKEASFASADGATSYRCSVFTVKGNPAPTADDAGTFGLWSALDCNNNRVGGQVYANMTITTPCVQDHTLNLKNATVTNAVPCGTYMPSPIVPVPSGLPPAPSGDIKPVPPTYPNWGGLDCPTLESEIKKLELKISTNQIDQTYLEQAQNELTVAKNRYQTACIVKQPTTITATTTVTPVAPVFGGGFFGGGSGVGGEDGGVPQQAKRSNKGIWLLVAIAAGLYFILKKKKQ
jgi:hypothetical protein